MTFFLPKMLVLPVFRQILPNLSKYKHYKAYDNDISHHLTQITK